MQSNLASPKILVGIDFSEGSERALLRAVARAENEQAQLQLLHIFEWDPSAAKLNHAGDDSCDGSQPRIWQEVTAQAKIALQRLAQLCAGFVADRVPCEIRVLVGDPVLGLLDTATQIGASLIVLGSLGRRMLPHGSVGTTAARVQQNSRIPVLLVPHMERHERRQARPVSLSAAGQALWSCTRCGAVEQFGESMNSCPLCGDHSATWVSIPSPAVSFASLQ